ncbi:NRAMP family divalent metal transporter [Propioniferax innocua]|uniref:Mn2+/Fe2+ NRAMP family transporter n=1 Tax=Propioniferax innocua TaxID=1753 RepID=A0A542ZRL6_9ACTN|nr:divalent metal cation transporter [Propioniferax innocua]TQL62981.1 Mn2+/Fe2+ NRAMP family transporter [Propioniferax innocua]
MIDDAPVADTPEGHATRAVAEPPLSGSAPSKPPVQHASTWRTKAAALGPGIMAASAAIGGSHLVSSTQAGAIYGWQLVGVIVLALVLKYPFFRFAPQYTAETGTTVVEGYARKGKAYLWIFFILCTVSSVISAAGVGLLCTVILGFLLPASLSGAGALLTGIVMVVVWLLLVAGRFHALDVVSKVIVASLAVTTVIAATLAAAKGPAMAADFVGPSPWNVASLAFIVALVGWMPAPIEIAAINSLWVTAKQRTTSSSTRDVIFDFNVGFITSGVLALVFVGLGFFVQFGTGVEVAQQGGKYIPQLMSMYGQAIGQWAIPMMAFIAFATMFGTTISVVDGYARACAESIRLIRGQAQLSQRSVLWWITGITAVSLAIMLWMNAEMAAMLRFSMISAFVTAPVFAWLNYSLVRKNKSVTPMLHVLAILGIIFLTAFTLLFLASLMGLLG